MKYVRSIHDAIETLEIGGDAATQTAHDTLIKTLHTAMRLEASTVPPYYVAAWSIQDSDGYENAAIRELVSSISREEMLHMMSISNIISATGTIPQIATPEIVLNWGTDTLPVGGDLVPSLSPFSIEILTDLFMEIEQPLDPVHYVVVEARAKARGMAVHYATIGEFYDALIVLINTFPEDPFANGESHPQIDVSNDTRFSRIGHDPIKNFIVKNKKHAIELLNWIVDQGEGSSAGPLDGNGDPAHYYRFAEIYKGGKLVKDISQPLGYAYDRARFPINCDFTKIMQFASNPKMKDFSPESRQYKGLKAFNQKYKLMFEQLQQFYEGAGDQAISDSINSMNSMARLVPTLFACTPPVCPSFEWIE